MTLSLVLAVAVAVAVRLSLVQLAVRATREFSIFTVTDGCAS